jgi:hypothetical protein
MDAERVHAGPGTEIPWRHKWVVILACVLVAAMTLVVAGPALADVGTVMLGSSTAAGVQGSNPSSFPSISGNGRFTVFASSATNLVSPATTGQQDFRKDLSTGAIVLVSANAAGTQGNNVSGFPKTSYDGRYVVFESTSTNLFTTATTGNQIFRKDLETGAVALASANAAGTQGNAGSSFSDISADGRYVTFQSASTNLFTTATTGTQVFRKDLMTGEVALASSNAAGVQGNNTSQFSSMSTDAQFVVFASNATNLFTTPTTGAQIFRKDLATGAVSLISSSAAGVQGNNATTFSGISPEGNYVAFSSAATNLLTTPTTGQQVFMKNVLSGQVSLISASAAGTQGNAASLYGAAVSAGGNYVSFASPSTNLLTTPTTGTQMFRKETATGAIVLASATAAGVQGNNNSVNQVADSISDQGRYTVYYGLATNLVTPATTGTQVFRKELSVSFYFAEGTCRPGFDPYLTIQNPGGAAADTKITYMKGDGTTQDQTLSVPAHARSTVTVKQILGEGDNAAHDFSCKVECTNGQTIIAERPMYFNYKPGELNWNDGSDVVGALAPTTAFYFAEGTCRPGFDPYLTIQNPGAATANIKITYMKGDGTTQEQTTTITAHTRSTITVKQILGEGDNAAHDFSCKIESTNGVNIVAERPMYFNYKPGQLNWNGGHDVVGAIMAYPNFFFAEGTCRPGFDPYLTIQNPGAVNANVTITYMKGDGTTQNQTVTVNAHTRSTVTVKQILGEGNDAAHDFSCSVVCTNGVNIIAERPMYFSYKPGELNWTGGHDTVGAFAPGVSFFFAEGTCRPGFDPYLTVQNPGATAADVKITYMKGDGTTQDQTINVPAHARSTVTVKQTLGQGDDAAHDFSCLVTSTNAQNIIAERPMYFNYRPGVLNWTGGTDVVGLTP